jgi:hypothetical protein
VDQSLTKLNWRCWCINFELHYLVQCKWRNFHYFGLTNLRCEFLRSHGTSRWLKVRLPDGGCEYLRRGTKLFCSSFFLDWLSSEHSFSSIHFNHGHLRSNFLDKSLQQLLSDHWLHSPSFGLRWNFPRTKSALRRLNTECPYKHFLHCTDVCILDFTIQLRSRLIPASEDNC